MQLQADLLSVPCVRPTVLETTALGSAFLAGLAVGVWSDTAQVGAAWAQDRRFHPAMPASQVRELRSAWAAAVSRA